ncbi:putative ribonuclease H-like domain-containing protein [Tanacetum coccineum]
MLADSLLPTTFWAEAVSTAYYVQNRVLVIKPHNKTPYELLHGRPPSICFMRPFRCPVTILNTLDPLGKFDRKADEGFFVGYSINSKAVRVFNSRARKVEENLHINFIENKPNVAGSGLDWLFDIDLLTNSLNYEPVTAGNQTNKNAVKRLMKDQQMKVKEMVKKRNEELQIKKMTRIIAGQSFTNADDLPTDSLMPNLEDTADLLNTGVFSSAYDDEDVSAEADLNNLETIMNVIQALTDPSWIEAMQEELLQFKFQKVWTLVDLPKGKRAIGTKWVYRNKKDERGIVVRNKARLVAQGYTKEEGIYYDECSVCYYGTIEEEVYVCQPPSFEDLQFLNKVYKVEKALYGLHQALKAWCETLSTYLLENRFRKGIIDKTLFIKKNQGDILLVQVYLDDIIFGSTKKSLRIEFEILMHKKFQMSSIGELTFFLGLQAASTPIETNKALNKDEEAEDVDVHLYRSMIGSLIYLTASRPDIMFVVCACARDSPFDLEAFSDSDYTRASLDKKSTTGGVMDSKSNA